MRRATSCTQVSMMRTQRKKTNRLVRFSLCWCGLRFANGAIAPACVRAQHFVLHLLAMSTVLDFRKCCALASLFACGLPRLAQQRLLPKVNRVQRTVPVPTMQALLPANCSICRGSSSSVSAKKEKTRTKFVLIFLWCGHRDLNSDGVTIRPSNVRVCLFRHDRLTLLII